MVIQLQKDFRTPNRQEQKITSQYHIIVKTLNIQKKGKNIESCKREAPSHT
jgi:hypothetical protein